MSHPQKRGWDEEVVQVFISQGSDKEGKYGDGKNVECGRIGGWIYTVDSGVKRTKYKM
jgi:hypothetical protein